MFPRKDEDKDEGRLAQIASMSGRYFRMTPPDVLKSQVTEWTSVKTPVGGHLKTAMASVKVDDCLHRGITVIKVTSRGSVKSRVITVSVDNFALFVTHSRVKGSAKSEIAAKLPLPLVTRKGIRGFGRTDLRSQYVRYIDVADLQGVQVGVVGTPKLELARDKSRLKGHDSLVDVLKDEIVSIFHHGDKTLDLMIKNKQEREALIVAIQEMQQAYEVARHFHVPESCLLRYMWYDIDKDHNGRLNRYEFAKLLNRINLQIKNPTKIYKKFQKEKMGANRQDLSYTQVMDLLTRIRQGKVDGNQVNISLFIFQHLFGKDADYVSAADFLKFLHTKQHEEDATEKDVAALFRNINMMELNRDESDLPVKEGFMSKYRFFAYLHHAINDAYNPDDLELATETLGEPMSRYWINTSHNTYLTGDQLQSTSSVYMYATALRRGCKCLELDCWDGEKSDVDGNLIPVVYHGYTITTKICFKDIIHVVHAYVEANPETYPIILSLENHCSKPYQQVMANNLKDILGDKLYRFDAERDMNADLPSPQSMKGKVVIKGKRPPDSDESPLVDDTNEIDPYNMSVVNNSMVSEDGEIEVTDSVSPSSKAHSKILPELAALTLFHGTKFKSFDASIQAPPSHMHSIGETKITKIVAASDTNAEQWRQYNLHHMTRTYPAGSRVDSSNYNPILAWAMGSQMVALNFQTPDAPLKLNDGRFRQNGGCGYVLKPPSVMGTEPRPGPATLKVRVLSGTCLPKPEGETMGEVIDPYVIVTVEDVVYNGDNAKEEYKASSHTTEVIDDNGFNPVWNESDFKIFEIQTPDVAMVHFAVQEKDVTLDDKLANASIPFSCLRRGYRSIQLYDMNDTRTGPFSMASLLVQIDY